MNAIRNHHENQESQSTARDQNRFRPKNGGQEKSVNGNRMVRNYVITVVIIIMQDTYMNAKLKEKRVVNTANAITLLPCVVVVKVFKAIYQRVKVSTFMQLIKSKITQTLQTTIDTVLGVSRRVEYDMSTPNRVIKTKPVITEKTHVRIIIDTVATINILDSKAFVEIKNNSI